jgi:uncharacterized protein involved in response to NO
MCAFLVSDTVWPQSPMTAVIAGVAALAQLARLAGWHGLRTLRDPIVWILHVGYAWLPIGLALKALYGFGGFAFAAYWQHALGAGVAGTMIMAVMTRAALGHTGRALAAHPLTTAAYLVLTLAVALRVFGSSFHGISYQTVVLMSGALWILAFTLYLIVYVPILSSPRVDGRPG